MRRSRAAKGRSRTRIAGGSAAAALILALVGGGILWATGLYPRVPLPEARNRPPAIIATAAPVGIGPPHRAVPPKPAEPAVVRLPLPGPPPASAMPAWRRFAAPAPPAGNRPRVAVVVDDLGLDRRRTAEIVDVHDLCARPARADRGGAPRRP
jgi:hypothetical protein